MAEYNPSKATTTDLTNTVDDYSVDPKNLDTVNTGNEETEWYFNDAAQNFGYYKTIPEFKQSIDGLAMWTCGKGYTAGPEDEVTLDMITGWGEDSFQAIMTNMIIVKKVVGDSFAEIIRNDNGTLINLKPISPERMKIVVNKQGLIIRYEQFTKQGWQKYEPQKILHLCNSRVGDEIHGVSALESCKWVIDAKNEAMDVYRKILKRSLAMGILYIDTNDAQQIAAVQAKYQTAVNNGEVLVLPSGTAEVKDAKISVQDFLSWIQYLDNVFYQQIGVPKIILGGSQEFTEASSKVGYLTFEQVYMTEQRELESDILKQLGIRIKFERPASLMDSMQTSEAANTGQTGIQPKEAGINMERE